MATEVTRSVEPMTPNTKVENIQHIMDGSPAREGLKRKAGDEVNHNPENKENGGSEKKAKVDEAASNLVELKGRKLVFKQDATSRKLPRRQLLNLEGWLLDEVEAGNKITEIPEEFWGLIVMAGHELNSSNESLFIKHLKSALEVTKGGQDPLPNEAIQPLVSKLFTLTHYGFIPSDFSPSSSTTKVPATLQIRCWEANDLQKYFPANQLDELLVRKKQREKAREECVRILDGLDDIEKMELIKGEKADRTQVKEVKEKTVKVEEVTESPKINRRKSREGTANTVESRGRSASPTKKSKLTPEEEEAARIKKEERDAKKAELAEKKAIRDREKEKRDAIIAKQAKTMMGFFNKAKPPVKPISRASEAGPSRLQGNEASPVKGGGSDYARVFRPLAQRPHVKVADINCWKYEGDNTDGESSILLPKAEVETWGAKDFINDHLRKHNKQARSSRKRLPIGLKTMPPYGSVADVYNTLEDADDPRAVLSQLNDRSKFPWKTLAFDQQTRPPYCGTFTKKSIAVGPRTPFAQDPVFDYSYDSSDDWVDDEGGEDVDDFGDGEAKEDEEDEEGDEDEGEFDDWLDDAEDVEFTPIEGDMDPTGEPQQARLPMKVVKKSRDVAKKVVKLNPSWKGPIWETKIGEEGTDGMEGYRIQLLNDTPHSVDPFTFNSPEPVQKFKTSFSTTVIGTTINVRCLLSVQPIVPAQAPLPILTPEIPLSVPNSSSISQKPIYPSSTPITNGENTLQARSRLIPKVGFPEEHLAELYKLIEGSTKIKPDLVSQLRERFENIATKVAIEAKLKEVAVREGKTKDSQWKVKSEAWTSIGLTPPVTTPSPALTSAPNSTSTAAAVPINLNKTVADFFSSPGHPVTEKKEKSLGSTIDEPMIIDA